MKTNLIFAVIALLTFEPMLAVTYYKVKRRVRIDLAEAFYYDANGTKQLYELHQHQGMAYEFGFEAWGKGTKRNRNNGEEEWRNGRALQTMTLRHTNPNYAVAMYDHSVALGANVRCSPDDFITANNRQIANLHLRVTDIKVMTSMGIYMTLRARLASITIISTEQKNADYAHFWVENEPPAPVAPVGGGVGGGGGGGPPNRRRKKLVKKSRNLEGMLSEMEDFVMNKLKLDLSSNNTSKMEQVIKEMKYEMFGPPLPDKNKSHKKGDIKLV